MIKGLPLTVILAAIIAAFFAMDYYFMFRFDRERQEKGKGWSWDYTLFTFAVGAVILLQPLILPGLAWNVASAAGLAIQLAGGGFVLASFALHIWARTHLRKFYVERVEVQSDHQLIDTGPYAYVRHPIITSFFGLAAGLFLLNPAITTALVLAYTLWDFNRAARQEETLLENSVSGYAEYMTRTPRYFPHLWRHS